MHEYTETESKHTGKIGTHNMWKQMYINVHKCTLKLKIMPSKVRLINFKIKKNKHTFYFFTLIITVQIFSLC